MTIRNIWSQVRHTWTLTSKVKFTSAEECVCISDISQASQHTPLSFREQAAPCSKEGVEVLGFTVFVIGNGPGLWEGIGEEQTWLESIDTRLNLIGVSKDKEVIP
jgi:hypothetical protein